MLTYEVWIEDLCAYEDRSHRLGAYSSCPLAIKAMSLKARDRHEQDPQQIWKVEDDTAMSSKFVCYQEGTDMEGNMKLFPLEEICVYEVNVEETVEGEFWDPRASRRKASRMRMATGFIRRETSFTP